jgi:transposase
MWPRVAPLLPVVVRRKRNPGRKRLDDRACLEGILYVLFSGLPWSSVPAELGVSGVTCWRRLEQWQRQGVWERLLAVLREELERAGRAEGTRLIVDSSLAPAKKGAPRRGQARWTEAARQANAT